MKQILHYYRYFLLFILLLLSGSGYAQNTATSFKLYAAPADPQVEQWMLTFTGAPGTEVTYTPIGQSPITVTIPSEQMIRVTIPKANLPSLANLNTVTSNRFIPVTATAPIQVVQEIYSSLTASQDAAYVLPEASWGTKYTGTSFNMGGYGTLGFNIFSATDNNQVTIKHRNGTTLATFTLNSGQNYLYNVNLNSYSLDISGYTIEATNKVGVMMYSSSQTNADLAGNDNLVEFVLPDAALGTKFVSRAFATAFQMMITATQDNTTVKINGNLVSTLNKGQTYFYYQVNTADIFETNFPVQFGKVSPGGNVQDPSFVNVLDVNKATTSPVIYRTLPNMTNENVLTIYARTADTGKIRYNDQAITRWVPFAYDPSLSWATVASNVIDFVNGYIPTQFPLVANTYFKVSSTTGDVPFMTDYWGWGHTYVSTSTTLAVGNASLVGTPCAAGFTAPTLSATTLSNTCPATTANLSSLTASNTPTGTSVTWHTAATASDANKIANPGAVASGTYYAAFYDAAGTCYSPTTAVTVTQKDCTDTDGDGVPDIDDVDDDNDGILDTVECGPSVNLVTNGSLTGPSIGSACAFQAQIPPGWTATNITPETFSLPLNSCMGQWAPSNDGGSWVVSGGWNGNGEAFAQTISGLTVGKKYKVSFEQTVGSSSRTIDLPAQGGYWEVTFGSEVQKSDLVPVSSGAVGWFNQSLTFTATSTSQQLQFKGALDPSVTSGLSYMGIDGIKVELINDCDTDGDGIPNRLDLDSDNDGCLDATEGGAAITASQLVNAAGTASAGTGSTAVARNLCAGAGCVSASGSNSGLPQFATLPANYSNTTGQTVGDSQNSSVSTQCVTIPDTDGDTIADNEDVDDDNDGILDTAESTCAKQLLTNGTFDTNLTGWTVTGNVAQNAGTMVFNGSNTAPNGVVQQTVTTFANQPLTLTYQQGATGSGGPAGVRVEILENGTVIATTTNQYSAGQFGNHALSFTTATGTFSVRITDVTPSTTGLDAYVDNLFLVSSWCDTDADGIPDHLDLDSDNDGCVDAVEGGASFAISNTVPASGTASVGAGSSANPLNLCDGPGCVSTTGSNKGLPQPSGTFTGYSNTTGQTVGDSKNAAANRQCNLGGPEELVDSDGDGVPDITDVDDDNDGILDTVECNECAAGSDLFTNGGFELPVIGTNTYILRTDVPGWSTTASDNYIEIWGSGFAGYASAEGNQFVELNANEASTLYQTFCVPKGGGTLSWSVKHRGRDNATFPDVAEVRIGTSLTNYTVVATMSDTSTAWGSYSGQLSVPANSGGTYYIMFSAISSANGNVTGGNFLDDVNVSIVANCTDSDGDGVVDKFDLDSDNDGCVDAMEGAANVRDVQLVTAAGTVAVGTGSTASNQNLCNNNFCVATSGSNIGLPQFFPPPTGYSNATGQSLGDAQNSTAVTCFCYAPSVTSGTVLDTRHGITALGRAGADNSNWPMVRKGAWTALEAKTKGFVVNRLTDAQIAAIPAADLIEGMMVYNTTQDCLYINTNGTATGWKCYQNQTCN